MGKNEAKINHTNKHQTIYCLMLVFYLESIEKVKPKNKKTHTNTHKNGHLINKNWER